MATSPGVLPPLAVSCSWIGSVSHIASVTHCAGRERSRHPSVVLTTKIGGRVGPCSSARSTSVGETSDALGHVNNAVYATYFEEARDRWLMQALAGITPITDFALARVAIDYKR